MTYIPAKWTIATCRRALQALNGADMGVMSVMANTLGISRRSYERLGPEGMRRMLSDHIREVMQAIRDRDC